MTNGLVVEMADTIDNMNMLMNMKACESVQQEPVVENPVLKNSSNKTKYLHMADADDKVNTDIENIDNVNYNKIDDMDDESCLDIECDEEPADPVCDPIDDSWYVPMKQSYDREDADGLMEINESVFGGEDFRVFHGRLSKDDCCSSTFVMDVKKDMYRIMPGSEIPRHDPEFTGRNRLNSEQLSERDKYIQTYCVSVQRIGNSSGKIRNVYVVGPNAQWLTYAELRNILQDTADTVTAYYDIYSQEGLNVTRRNYGITKRKSKKTLEQV